MATVVRGRVPAEEFALYDSLAGLPGVEFDTELIVESGADTVMPLLWVRGVDTEAVRTAFEDDPSVKDVELLADLDGDQFYRMKWIDHVDLVFEILTNKHATVMDAYGAGDEWHLRVFYPTRDDLSQTHEFCENNGLTFEVETIHEMEGEPAGRYGLTDGQYEALVRAIHAGYFEIPRETTTEELADELGISHQALSERLRRATSALVEDTLLIGPRSENIEN